MHTLAQMLSAVLVTAFFFFQTAIAHADGLFSATVTQCTDGDTLVLDTGQRVRLAGVDTPEKGSKDTPPQYYAREAERFTCEPPQPVGTPPDCGSKGRTGQARGLLGVHPDPPSGSGALHR